MESLDGGKQHAHFKKGCNRISEFRHQVRHQNKVSDGALHLCTSCNYSGFACQVTSPSA